MRREFGVEHWRVEQVDNFPGRYSDWPNDDDDLLELQLTPRPTTPAGDGYSVYYYLLSLYLSIIIIFIIISAVN